MGRISRTPSAAGMNAHLTSKKSFSPGAKGIRFSCASAGEGDRRRVRKAINTMKTEFMRTRNDEKAITKARRDEDTKEEKAFLNNVALFRAFPLSCFRDEFLGFHSVFCILCFMVFPRADTCPVRGGQRSWHPGTGLPVFSCAPHRERETTPGNLNRDARSGQWNRESWFHLPG